MRRKLICTDERQETRLKPILEEGEEPNKEEEQRWVKKTRKLTLTYNHHLHNLVIDGILYIFWYHI